MEKQLRTYINEEQLKNDRLAIKLRSLQKPKNTEIKTQIRNF